METMGPHFARRGTCIFKMHNRIRIKLRNQDFGRDFELSLCKYMYVQDGRGQCLEKHLLYFCFSYQGGRGGGGEVIPKSLPVLSTEPVLRKSCCRPRIMVFDRTVQMSTEKRLH